MTVQAKTLILLNFFIADSPAKHQQSGKLGLYHLFFVDIHPRRTRSNYELEQFPNQKPETLLCSTSTLDFN